MFGDKKHSLPNHLRGGTLISTPYDGGRVVQQDTIKCVHCGYQSIWVAGSEKWWGHCARCAGPTCGRLCCKVMGCVPEEQQLDNLEQGRLLGFRPIVATVEGEIPC